MDANLQGIHLVGTNLQNIGLVRANLQNANLQDANLQGANLHSADLQSANLEGTRLQGVDLSKVKDMSKIHISGAWLDRTRMRREQLGNAIGEELAYDYTRAKNGYIALKQNFDALGDYEGASWAYRKERPMEKLEAWRNGRSSLTWHIWRDVPKSYFKFFSDTFVEWLCDYGESAWRVVGWMAALLFIIGLLLFSVMGGFVWREDLAKDYFSLSSSLQRLWFWYYHYLLYTLDALTTASFSELRPANDAVKLVSGLFAITGIILAGLLGFAVGNRIRRS